MDTNKPALAAAKVIADHSRRAPADPLSEEWIRLVILDAYQQVQPMTPAASTERAKAIARAEASLHYARGYIGHVFNKDEDAPTISDIEQAVIHIDNAVDELKAAAKSTPGVVVDLLRRATEEADCGLPVKNDEDRVCMRIDWLADAHRALSSANAPEGLGRAEIDEAIEVGENVLAATQLPMPPSLHVEGLKGGIEKMIAKLRAAKPDADGASGGKEGAR